ncbi:hypothetical protein BpHYR1_017378, partial [Brachionus plicatilis]
LSPVQTTTTFNYSNVQPGTSASFLDREICLPVDQPISLGHEQLILDQQMTSLTTEADIANLTSGIYQSKFKFSL